MPRSAVLALVSCLAVAVAQARAGVPSGDPAPASAALLDPVERRRILELSPLPAPPPDSSRVADDPRAARLGQFLFFDRRLSADGERACATCHVPHHGFADGLPLPTLPGAGNRHTPTLWNVAYNRWYFWDGRADSLWAQALQPIELGGDLGGGRRVAARLVHDDPALRRAYESVFGPLPDLAAATFADRAVAEVVVNLAKAIAAYERRLVSRRSLFDVFVEGLRAGDASKLAALDPTALAGLRLFVGRAGCRVCHSGPNFTDGEFHDTGIAPRSGAGAADTGRYAGAALLRRDPFNAASTWSDDPRGPAAERLERLAGGPETRGQFKTPTLRNVDRTAPYMHQGQLATLEQVIEHYSTLRGATFGPAHGGADSSETILRPLALSSDEIAALVAFLGSLTDEAVDPDLLEPPSSPELDDGLDVARLATRSSSRR
jgi:cytochrome c peroxidase